MRRRVLIIDDDDSIREIAQASLELVGGHEVLTAEHGTQGIEVAQEARPDAILLDVMMPDMDGTEVFARLRSGADTEGIPVIFMTAKAQQQQLDDLGGIGAAGVIAKPFDAMTLASQVAAILGWQQG